MSFYSFLEYLKYYWRAKGLHGTHSPFVYDFVANVLMDKGPIQPQNRIEFNSLPLKYENLINRIAAYYGCKEVLFLTDENKQRLQADMLLLNDDISQWNSFLNTHKSLLKSDAIIMVPHIHKSRQHSYAWQKLASHEATRMSIDLFEIGLMLFREEFKEKQHFVLKY